MIILYVTHPDEEHAVSILNMLMEEKLVACGNIFPAQSHYPWKGELVIEGEFISIMKTVKELEEKAITKIEQLHSYEIPCILSYSVNANPSYYNWIKGCLKE